MRRQIRGAVRRQIRSAAFRRVPRCFRVALKGTAARPGASAAGQHEPGAALRPAEEQLPGGRRPAERQPGLPAARRGAVRGDRPAALRLLPHVSPAGRAGPGDPSLWGAALCADSRWRGRGSGGTGAGGPGLRGGTGGEGPGWPSRPAGGAGDRPLRSGWGRARGGSRWWAAAVGGSVVFPRLARWRSGVGVLRAALVPRALLAEVPVSPHPGAQTGIVAPLYGEAKDGTAQPAVERGARDVAFLKPGGISWV